MEPLTFLRVEGYRTAKGFWFWRDTGQQEVPGFELWDTRQPGVKFWVQGSRFRIEGYRATRQRLANHVRAVPTEHLFEGLGFRIEDSGFRV